MAKEVDYSKKRMRVENVSDATWKDKFEGETYVIEPGEKDTIPVGAYWCWFGHPFARDYELSKQEKRERYCENPAKLPSPWPPLVEVVPSADKKVEQTEEAEEAEETPEAETAFPGLSAIPPRKTGKKK